MEKFREKTYFIGQLGLKDEIREEIMKAYYGDEAELLQDTYHYSVEELHMYKKLLLIARTHFFTEEEQLELRVTPRSIFELEIGEPKKYYINCQPDYLELSTWLKLCAAFASLGFLRSYNDRRDVNWAEVDCTFRCIIDHYADPELAIHQTIGYLHPKYHEEYEVTTRDLGYSDFGRLNKYLTAIFPDWIYAPDIYGVTYKSGEFLEWVLNDIYLCQKLARTETLINIDKIYRGAPITITF